MYSASDPRAALSSAPTSTVIPDSFAPAELGLFYQEEPQESGADGKTWYIRGQNFVVAHSEALPGAVFSRLGQADEYALLIGTRDTPYEISAGGQTVTGDGYAVVFIPPGDSRIVMPKGGTLTRFFTIRSNDLAAKCANAASYAVQRANIPEFQAWPVPESGLKIRAYGLDVPSTPGRFGRIWRCTTFMINVLDPQVGPRDITKLSPHHHDDFEQCSLALEGSFIHHLRWPWTPDMNAWREDEHPHVRSPSVTIIPPPAVHTTRGMEPGVNQLVDVFCPPRIDFSQKAGWVLNADDYPMPTG